MIIRSRARRFTLQKNALPNCIMISREAWRISQQQPAANGSSVPHHNTVHQATSRCSTKAPTLLAPHLGKYEWFLWLQRHTNEAWNKPAAAFVSIEAVPHYNTALIRPPRCSRKAQRHSANSQAWKLWVVPLTTNWYSALMNKGKSFFQQFI